MRKHSFVHWGEVNEEANREWSMIYWVVVSKIFYFHSENWGRCPILTSIFFRWVETTDQLFVEGISTSRTGSAIGGG